MTPPHDNDATRLLARMGGGDSSARDELLRVLYRELHELAERSMRHERPDHTLQPTALVHEAWMRLTDSTATPTWESRAHFLGVAARAMRNVLVDHARRRAADKRGANVARIELDDTLASYNERALDVLALDEALERLAQRDGELARLVELRFFGGLTTEETGKVLGLSVRQVEGAWVTARGWLHRELAARGV
jgi:RNA polymerase sigma factor (TIGR02999 family)